MKNKLTLLLKGSTFRILRSVIAAIIGLIMMPFLILTLGVEHYGLWVVVGSIVGTFHLLDLGFAQAVTRFVTKYISQNRTSEANRIISTSLLIYLLLGFLILLISIFISMFGVQFFIDDIDMLPLTKILIIISGISFALEFPSKAFPGIISAYMRFDFIAQVRTIKIIVDALLIYLFLSNGFGIIALAVIVSITSLLSTLAFVFFSTRLFKDLYISYKLINLDVFKKIFHFSKWVFIFDLNAILRDKIDIWFVAFYLGANTLTVYYVAFRLVEYATQFISQATDMTTPLFTESYAKKDFSKLNKYFSLSVKVTVSLSTILISGFIIFGDSFIFLWMHSDFDYQNAYLSLIILAFGKIMVSINTPFQSLLLTYEKHNISAKTSVVETICSTVLCVLLIPKFGLIGAAISISSPLIIFRLIVTPVIITQIINLDFKSLLIRSGLYMILILIASLILKLSIIDYKIDSWLLFLCFSTSFSLLNVGISLFIFNNDELTFIYNRLPKWMKNVVMSDVIRKK